MLALLSVVPLLVIGANGRPAPENYGGPVVTAGGLVFIGGTSRQLTPGAPQDSGGVYVAFALPKAPANRGSERNP